MSCWRQQDAVVVIGDGAVRIVDEDQKADFLRHWRLRLARACQQFKAETRVFAKLSHFVCCWHKF
ncbi:hypothetical protein BpHYR1_021084 [Brachionus plicatilis]|uniref:Uncharacterized protein n=1 Tax=Brachionus plicatilis TaxID=10195 RepID=A0A3M7P7Y8_BRAPC|nr:hypothetical protein BpHYR1_021084 [Brachionus plicatilis]